jgi:hypothetical protein
MHRSGARVVDTSPTRWLLGLTFYKSDRLREVEDFLFVLDSESVHCYAQHQHLWILWNESETPMLERTGVMYLYILMNRKADVKL